MCLIFAIGLTNVSYFDRMYVCMYRCIYFAIPTARNTLTKSGKKLSEICFYSRSPLSSNNECPSGTTPPSPAEDSVEVLFVFEHDFYPEETVFRVLSKDSNIPPYAGPRYVPSRNSAWTSRLHLLPVGAKLIMTVIFRCRR